VAGITIACIVMAKRQKLWLSAWGYYVITLVPVLGIVQVGRQSMADRYTYLPGLGPFVLAGIIGAWIWARVTRLRTGGSIATFLAAGMALVLIFSLSYLTVKQSGIWKNSFVFWSYVIEKEPERVPDAYNNRGSAFYKKGMSDKAIEDYDRAIALDPSYYEAYNNRGTAFLKAGLFDKAIADFDRTISINPEHAAPYVNRGRAYFLLGKYAGAEEDFNKAISLNKNYAVVYFNRGILYYRLGNRERAVADFRKACDLGNNDGCRAWSDLRY
jgi:tetratricopeptide (TPR) repeat protein